MSKQTLDERQETVGAPKRIDRPKQESPELLVFHPKQKPSSAATNRFLERCVQEIVRQCSPSDLHMRFFGLPNVEAIPGKITGRIPDRYEQPRDTVIVAFTHRRPAGYIDITRFAKHPEIAEMSLLVRSDQQRRGIGEVLLRDAIRAEREVGIRRFEAYVHLENTKMKRAISKWSQAEGMRDVRFRTFYQEGELTYVLDLEPLTT